MFNPPNPQIFFATVWDITRQIPPGRVSSYGQIASMIPPAEYADPQTMRRLAARWVGTAMRKSPHGIAIPWQRVINSQGRISFPPGSPQAAQQQRLLESEGIQFDGGRVDLQRYGWQGPPESYLRARNLLPPRSLT
ncbi:MAG: MGMT family protein [Chloroflexi bacterium]|nr:MGMT family protein [Chloroflexota bacterium]MCY4247156.1 MGMT family protein [Chloroflexota bacterium]